MITAGLALLTALAAQPLCAGSNDLPFSSSRAQRLENSLAERVGRQLGQPVRYSWWPQRPGLVRGTGAAHRCGAVRAGLEVQQTARPVSSARARVLPFTLAEIGASDRKEPGERKEEGESLQRRLDTMLRGIRGEIDMLLKGHGVPHIW